MPDIFKYTDYRKFLSDWYHEKKDANPSFSYRLIAGQVGYKSPAYLSMITSGKIGMSLSMSLKFASFMKLKKRETDFFQEMILFCDSKTNVEKSVHFDKMRAFRESSLYTVNKDQFEYYGTWYHSAIRSILEFFDFKNEYKEIASILVPAITPLEAEESIRLLKRLNLIDYDKEGFLRPCDALLTSGYDSSGYLVTNFMINSMRLSEKALCFFPRTERNFSCLTLGMSENGFTQIQSELREFRRKIMQIAVKDNAERIYQLSFQLFPLSKKHRRAAKK